MHDGDPKSGISGAAEAYGGVARTLAAIFMGAVLTIVATSTSTWIGIESGLEGGGLVGGLAGFVSGLVLMLVLMRGKSVYTI